MINRFHRRRCYFERLEDRQLLNADPALNAASPPVAIVVDPSDPSGNTVYISGANGGVWKTTNFSPTRDPVTDIVSTTGDSSIDRKFQVTFAAQTTAGAYTIVIGPVIRDAQAPPTIDSGADSIWIDLGFPVVATAGTQAYKPLFAFYVEELDGRVNVNVYGNVAPGGTLDRLAVDPNNPHYDNTFLGGVFVAAGDVNGDCLADIISVRGSGEPQLRVFDGASGLDLSSFFADWPRFAGGVTVAAGDVNTDGRNDVVTGAGPGAGPHVKITDDATPRPVDRVFAQWGTTTD